MKTIKHTWTLIILLACFVTFASPVPVSADDKNLDISLNAPESVERAGYRVGVGDILHIMTWKEPDFTLEAMVRRDGKITFPLLDDLKAGGLKPVELKREIQKQLKRFIEDPIVTVMVKTPDSQKFYILGEVQKAGEYPLKKGLTVLQAFAMAGGFTEWASKKNIVVLRREQGQEKLYKINYKEILKGKDLTNNLWLMPNDTIIVP